MKNTEKTTKICSKCGIEKDISDYTKSSKNKSTGRRSECKTCESTRKRKYYNENCDTVLQKCKKYYEDNKESILYKHSEYSRRVRADNPELAMFKRSAKRAARHGIPFSISIDDIVIPKFCPILGIELEIANKSGGSMNSPSLDRLIPSSGYVKGNVWVISKLANTMKSSADEQQLRLFAKWIMEGININYNVITQPINDVKESN